jgi:hypothetical protein
LDPSPVENLQTDYEQRVSLVFPKSYRVRLLESRRIRGARFLPSTGLSASTRVQQADPLEDRRVAEPRCANESVLLRVPQGPIQIDLSFTLSLERPSSALPGRVPTGSGRAIPQYSKDL